MNETRAASLVSPCFPRSLGHGFLVRASHERSHAESDNGNISKAPSRARHDRPPSFLRPRRFRGVRRGRGARLGAGRRQIFSPRRSSCTFSRRYISAARSSAASPPRRGSRNRTRPASGAASTRIFAARSPRRFSTIRARSVFCRSAPRSASSPCRPAGSTCSAGGAPWTQARDAGQRLLYATATFCDGQGFLLRAKQRRRPGARLVEARRLHSAGHPAVSSRRRLFPRPQGESPPAPVPVLRRRSERL